METFSEESDDKVQEVTKQDNVQPQEEFGPGIMLTEEEARQALLEYVSEQSCYGKGAVKDMVITKMTPTSAMHYCLETFCEGRLIQTDVVPYRGGNVDGPSNGTAPGPWKIPCDIPTHFVTKVIDRRIPHTASVDTCSTCRGARKVNCQTCRATGYRNCNNCSGKGEKQEFKDGQRIMIRCNNCNGRGENRCDFCNGRGEKDCSTCDANGKMMRYNYVSIKFTNYMDQYIVEQTALPKGLLLAVRGVEIFQDIKKQVSPITKFPIQTINENSIRLVEEAKQKHPNEKQHNQRHTLNAVPVTEVHYTFGNFSSKFWVYGLEKRVFSPDYPQQNCWGCTVL